MSRDPSLVLSGVVLVCTLAIPAAVAQDPKAKPVEAAAPKAIKLPGGENGIGFDDLRFARTLGRVLAPAGATGSLALIDPQSSEVTLVTGFAKDDFQGGHGEGTTSADEGAGFLFAIDRTADEVVVIDPKTKEIVARAKLASGPDYVRFVAPTRELWVTQPEAEAIEVFRLPEGAQPKPEHVASIAVPGGPESLVIDVQRGRAYTHLWKGATVAIDLRSRALVAQWKNGCDGSRGIALDEPRGLLFVGGAEGLATVLDVAHDGKELGRAATGKGVDIIDYDATRAHLYVPARDGTLTVLGVSTSGALSVLGTLPIVHGAQGVTTDGNGRVFFGDPQGGRLYVVSDTFPAVAH